MAIQAKGWLSNVVRVLYTICWQKILMTWMECFLILCRGISSLSGVVSQTTKLFQKKKSMKMEFTANTLGLNIKREEVEDNKSTLCKVVLTKRMNAQIDEDNPYTLSLLSLQATTIFRMDPRKLRKSVDSEFTFCKIIFTRRMMRTIHRQ